MGELEEPGLDMIAEQNRPLRVFMLYGKLGRRRGL